MSDTGQLDAKELRFVQEYLIDLDPKRSAIAAGYSETMANSKAYQWVSNSKIKPFVYKAIQKALKKRGERMDITADKVLKRWWAIATADPNGLVEFRRGACRFCWGTNNLFQRTPNEYARAYEEWQAMSVKAAENGREIGPFNEAGGIGFNPKKEPNPDCQECFGDGKGEPHFKDTRDLPEDLKALYAGVKQTRDGLELKIQDQATALDKVSRHLGLYNDKLEVDDVSKLTPEERLKRIEAIKRGVLERNGLSGQLD